MEEGWNIGPILIPLLALLVGWAIGFFDSNLRTSKKIKEAEDSAKAAIHAAEMKLTQEKSRLVSEASPVIRDDPGLMRIRSENGILTLDLEGVQVNTAALTTDQRRRLIEMLNAMRPWLEGKTASAPAPTVPPPAPPTPAPATQMAAPSSGTAPAPAQPVPARPAPPAKQKNDEPDVAPTSMVGQINQILQAHIVNTPLEAKGVTLMESITGGVNVFVGIHRYELIDDVPDAEVKAAIRAAIAEWEKKYTPGL